MLHVIIMKIKLITTHILIVRNAVLYLRISYNQGKLANPKRSLKINIAKASKL